MRSGDSCAVLMGTNKRTDSTKIICTYLDEILTLKFTTKWFRTATARIFANFLVRFMVNWNPPLLGKLLAMPWVHYVSIGPYLGILCLDILSSHPMHAERS